MEVERQEEAIHGEGAQAASAELLPRVLIAVVCVCIVSGLAWASDSSTAASKKPTPERFNVKTMPKRSLAEMRQRMTNACIKRLKKSLSNPALMGRRAFGAGLSGWQAPRSHSCCVDLALHGRQRAVVLSKLRCGSGQMHGPEATEEEKLRVLQVASSSHSLTMHPCCLHGLKNMLCPRAQEVARDIVSEVRSERNGDLSVDGDEEMAAARGSSGCCSVRELRIATQLYMPCGHGYDLQRANLLGSRRR